VPRHLAVLTVAAALGVAASGARAQERVRAVTLPEAIAAIGAAPEHRVVSAERAAAELEVAAAGAWPGTTVTANTSRKTARLGLVAAVPLPVFGTLSANKQVARAEYHVAEAQVGATDLGLRRDVTKAWVELARTEARADLSEANAKREEELATITKQREDSGDASHAEVVQAQAAAKRARAQAIVDRTAIVASSAELARLLGWDPDVVLHADGGFPPLGDVAGFEELAASRARHPEAQVAAARTDAEGARVVEASRARFPHLSLDLEAALDDPTLPGNDYRLGLNLEIPIFGHTAQAIDAAAARQVAARTQLDATMHDLDAQIVAAHKRYQAAREHVRSVEGDVLPAQREAAALARAAYREGQGGLVAVLEADRALADVEAEDIDAQAEAAAARADLDWASGGAR
jgi:cobalt-zinc-cadmium efflux system outer membrane protein